MLHQLIIQKSPKQWEMRVKCWWKGLFWRIMAHFLRPFLTTPVSEDVCHFIRRKGDFLTPVFPPPPSQPRPPVCSPRGTGRGRRVTGRRQRLCLSGRPWPMRTEELKGQRGSTVGARAPPPEGSRRPSHLPFPGSYLTSWPL